MSPEAQRLAIADIDGWYPTPDGRWTKDPAGLRGPICPTSGLPNYLNDRAAIQPVICSLSEDRQVEVVRFIVTSSAKIPDRLTMPCGWGWACLLATTPQLCESVLKSLGKWAESEASA